MSLNLSVSPASPNFSAPRHVRLPQEAARGGSTFVILAAGTVALSAAALLALYVVASDSREQALAVGQAVAVEAPPTGAAAAPEAAAVEPAAELPAVATRPLESATLSTVALAETGDVVPARIVKSVPVPLAAPSLDSPRWGEEGAAPGKAAIVEPAGTEQAPTGDGGIDPTATAFVETTDDSPAQEAAPAGTETAVAIPEAAPEVRKPVSKAKPVQQGTATEFVNLRAKPDNDSKVLSVIPASARVTVHTCKVWCEVTYKGTRGFVFNKFISMQS